MPNLLRWLKYIIQKNQSNNQSKKSFSEINKRSLLEHIKIFFSLKTPDILYTGNYFYNLKEAIRYDITGWKRDLLWCPSQLTKTIYYNQNWDIELYARWRWSDPWTGEFILKKKSNANFAHLLDIQEPEYEKSIWSTEVLSKYDFSDNTPIHIIESALEKEFKKYFIDKKDKIYFTTHIKL